MTEDSLNLRPHRIAERWRHYAAREALQFASQGTRVTGNQPPRALAAADGVTDAEKLAAHDSYIANSGTYETADSTLTIHPVVARSPNFMSGGSDKFTFRVSGDTQWLSNSGADIRTMIGGQLVAPSGPTSATNLVLVRQQ